MVRAPEMAVPTLPSRVGGTAPRSPGTPSSCQSRVRQLAGTGRGVACRGRPPRPRLWEAPAEAVWTRRLRRGATLLARWGGSRSGRREAHPLTQPEAGTSLAGRLALEIFLGGAPSKASPTHRHRLPGGTRGPRLPCRGSVLRRARRRPAVASVRQQRPRAPETMRLALLAPFCLYSTAAAHRAAPIAGAGAGPPTARAGHRGAGGAQLQPPVAKAEVVVRGLFGSAMWAQQSPCNTGPAQTLVLQQ